MNFDPVPPLVSQVGRSDLTHFQCTTAQGRGLGRGTPASSKTSLVCQTMFTLQVAESDYPEPNTPVAELDAPSGIGLRAAAYETTINIILHIVWVPHVNVSCNCVPPDRVLCTWWELSSPPPAVGSDTDGVRLDSEFLCSLIFT